MPPIRSGRTPDNEKRVIRRNEKPLGGPRKGRKVIRLATRRTGDYGQEHQPSNRGTHGQSLHRMIPERVRDLTSEISQTIVAVGSVGPPRITHRSDEDPSGCRMQKTACPKKVPSLDFNVHAPRSQCAIPDCATLSLSGFVCGSGAGATTRIASFVPACCCRFGRFVGRSRFADRAGFVGTATSPCVEGDKIEV
jgi:hypothetical protein